MLTGRGELSWQFIGSQQKLLVKKGEKSLEYVKKK
jgi:hypothetical protein